MDAFISSLSAEQRQELLKSLQPSAPAQKLIIIPAPSPLMVGRTLEELEEWMEDMEKHVISQGFNKTDPNIIYIYEQNFSEELKLQWRTYRRASRAAKEQPTTSLEDLKEWLKRFCLPNPRLEDYLGSLIRTKQGKASVADYIPRFHEAVARVPTLTAELVVAFFLVGLSDEIRQELRNVDPADLQEATAAALMVERRVAKAKTKTEASKEEEPKGPYKKGDRLRCSFCQRFGHDISSCRQLAANQPLVSSAPPVQPPPPPPVLTTRAARPLNF